MTGWFQRLKTGLQKSSTRLSTPLVDLLTKSKITPETLEHVEEILIQADLGVMLAAELTQAVRKERFAEGAEARGVLELLAKEIAQKLQSFARPLIPDLTQKPWVSLLVGVNGSGKTTTAGKLAAQWGAQGHTVTLVACDTFRAAATEQLETWATRAQARFHKGPSGCDSAALAFEALQDAQKRGTDILLIDTAGRLHNKAHLMEELSKTTRVLKKQRPDVPHSCLLVLDATIGQNAISQVESFQAMTPLTGLILTKLDGTAKGGILVDLAQRFKLPIHAIGVGENIDDLQPFDAQEFAEALMGL